MGYLQRLLLPAFALATSSSAVLFAMTGNAVPGMSKFTESGSGFNFSFWYPTAWKVTHEAVTDPTGSGWFPGAKIVKELKIHNPAFSAENNQPPGVILYEIQTSNGLTELGESKSASPVGVDGRYFFDRVRNRWMYAQLSDGPDGAHPSTYPAKIERRTMGGLPVLAGAARHGAEVIVPLDASHFLAIRTMDPGGYDSHVYLASTVEATARHRGSNRESQEKQAEAVNRERLKLQAFGDSSDH